MTERIRIRAYELLTTTSVYVSLTIKMLTTLSSVIGNTSDLNERSGERSTNDTADKLSTWGHPRLFLGTENTTTLRIKHERKYTSKDHLKSISTRKFYAE